MKLPLEGECEDPSDVDSFEIIGDFSEFLAAGLRALLVRVGARQEMDFPWRDWRARTASSREEC